MDEDLCNCGAIPVPHHPGWHDTLTVGPKREKP